MCCFNNQTNQTRENRIVYVVGQRGPRGLPGPSGFGGIASLYNPTFAVTGPTVVPITTSTVYPQQNNWYTYNPIGNTVTLTAGLYEISYDAIGTATGTDVPQLQLYINGVAYQPSTSQIAAGGIGNFTKTVVVDLTNNSTVQLYAPTEATMTLEQTNMVIRKLNVNQQ